MFPTTSWSLVVAAGQNAPAALSSLCERYWQPVYVFLRRSGHSPDAAQDLAQGFFTTLIEKHSVQAADPARGRFRSFLLASLRNWTANQHDLAGAQKRGGQFRFVPLDLQSAEHQCAADLAGSETPERAFLRRWALSLLDQVKERLRLESVSRGKADHFSLLKGYLVSGDDTVPYKELAQTMGSTEAAVKMTLSRLRRRYRELLLDEISQTVSDPAEVQDEVRFLFQALRG